MAGLIDYGVLRPWAWENSVQRRRRELAELQGLARQVRPLVEANDYAGAQALIAQSQPPTRNRDTGSRPYLAQVGEQIRTSAEARRGPKAPSGQGKGPRSDEVRRTGERPSDRDIMRRRLAGASMDEATQPAEPTDVQRGFGQAARLAAERNAGRGLGQRLWEDAVEPTISGETFVREAFGADTSGLPTPARYAIDTLAAPSTFLSAGIGGLASASARPGVLAARPWLQAAATQIGKRYATEGAADITGRVVGEQVAARLPEGTPAPVRVGAGILSGIAAGSATYSGLQNAPALGRGIDSVTDRETRALGRLGLDASPEAGEVDLYPWRRGRRAASGQTTSVPPGGDDARSAITSMLAKVEPTHVLSSLYGRLPFLRERGIGRLPDWMVEADDAYSTTSLIPLKEALDSDLALPLSAKLSNKFWKGLSAFNPNFATRLDAPGVREIGLSFRTADRQLIPQVADIISQVDGVKAFRGLELDDMGRALIDGKPVQFVNEKNVPIPRWYAGWADVLENPARYPEVMARLSPETRRAQADLSAKLAAIQTTSRDMGIRIEGAVVPSEGGIYVPRGRPVPVGREETLVSFRGQRLAGRRAGSTQERHWKSQAEAIARGYRYPHPVDAVREYVEENLRQQNAVHAAVRLKALPVGDSTLGAASVPEAMAAELGDLRAKIRPAQRELSGLKREEATVARDIRLEARAQQRAFRRHVELREIVRSRTAVAEEKATAAREAFDAARQQLGDAISATRDLAKQTAIATSDSDAARRDLGEVLARAQRLSRRLDQVEDELNAGRTASESASVLGRHSNFPRALYREAEEAWKEAEAVKRQAAAEAARIERQIAALPFDDVTARVQEARTTARRRQHLFGQALTGADGGVRSTARQMAEAARLEARAAENVRGAMAEGRIDELRRVWSERQLRALDMVQRQTRLGQRIQELATELEPFTTRRRELLQQVADVRRIARSRDMQFTGEFNLEPLRGVPVPAPLANAFNKYLADEPRGAATAVLDVINNALRALGATADASRQMTVGLLGQADRPLVAARAVRGGVRAAIDPSATWRELDAVQTRWKAKGIDVPLEEAVGRHGLQIAAAESTLAGAARKGTFEEKLARLPVIRQADALYSAPGNIERTERFYQTLASLKGAGRDWNSDQARAAAANIANLVSGRARRGVLSPLVGEEWSGRIAFAGRFVESQFETVANAILTGGIEGYEARRALLRLAVAGSALTYSLNRLLGEETTLDPRSPNFMRVRVAGRDVSLFGPWDSLVKGVVATAKGDPERFIRSKFAPVPALTYDATRGGGKNPVERILSPLSLAPVPFGVRDIGEAAMDTSFDDPSSLAALGLAAGASLLGIKNAPLTPTERLDELARVVIDPETGRPNDRGFYESSPEVQVLVKEAEPGLWDEAVRAGTKRRAEWEEVKRHYREEQDARDAQLLAGEIRLEDWDSARQNAAAERSGQFKAIYRDVDFPERNPVLDGYFDALDRAETNGVFDGSVLDEYLDGLSDRDRAYIERNTGTNASPLEKLRKRLASVYYELPRYRGYSGDEARQIDDLLQEVRNATGVREPSEARLLETLRRIGSEGRYQGKIIDAVRRKIVGLLTEVEHRERWSASHPEGVLLLGRGRLSTRQREAIRAGAAAVR